MSARTAWASGGKNPAATSRPRRAASRCYLWGRRTRLPRTGGGRRGEGGGKAAAGILASWGGTSCADAAAGDPSWGAKGGLEGGKRKGAFLGVLVRDFFFPAEKYLLNIHGLVRAYLWRRSRNWCRWDPQQLLQQASCKALGDASSNTRTKNTGFWFL